MKLKFGIAALVCLLLFSVPASALDVLEHWNSDSTIVYTHTSKPTAYYRLYQDTRGNNFTLQEVISYFNIARDQWHQKGMTSNYTTTESNAQIRVHVGEIRTLHRMFNKYRNYVNPRTFHENYQLIKEWQALIGKVEEYSFSHADVLIPYSGTFLKPDGTDGTAAKYKNVFTHEMGHGFGWHGHSSNTSDVMYSLPGFSHYLTQRDAVHITQLKKYT